VRARPTGRPHHGDRRVPAVPRTVREAVLTRRRAERAAQRALTVGDSVRDLLGDGRLTHTAVAERTGVPLGYLLWAYPDTAALTAAAAQRRPAPAPTCDDVGAGGAQQLRNLRDTRLSPGRNTGAAR